MNVRDLLRPKRLLAVAAIVPCLLAAGQAQAVEGGFSFYLLGSGGPEAALLPPLEGVFFDNTIFIYDASASAEKQFPIGGRTVAGLDATAVFNFTTFLWVPSTDVLGATLAVGGIAVFGNNRTRASAVFSGPLGNEVEFDVVDNNFTVGDPAFTAMLGWKSGKLHTTLSMLANVPVGDYHPGELANVALNRFALDTSLALSWHDDQSGWDLSAKVGYTYNGTNHNTDYNSGDDLHVEAAAEKMLGGGFSLGAMGYYYHQVSGDKGSGAVLGSFEGEIAGVGGTAAYRFKIGPAPVTVRAKVLTEFGAKNRLEGTSAFIGLGMPLWVNLPKQPVQ